MNDETIRSVLGALDGERELAPDRAAAIRSAMLSELDRATGDHIATVQPISDGAVRSRRWWVPAIVAAAVAMLVAGLVLFDDRAEAPVVVDEADIEQSFLAACAEFQLSTRRGDASWSEVLAEMEEVGDERAYRLRLADALESLIETPRAAPFRDAARDAVAAARGDGSPSALRAALDTVEEQSRVATGVGCVR